MIPDLSAILVVLNLGCAFACGMGAIIAAALVASYLAPFKPSDAQSSVWHETYTHTQIKLARVRARRLADLASIEDAILAECGHDATCERTVPSVPNRGDVTVKVSRSPIAVGMCVKVGEPAYEPTRTYISLPPLTPADAVVRALTLAHMRRQVA